MIPHATAVAWEHWDSFGAPLGRDPHLYGYVSFVSFVSEDVLMVKICNELENQIPKTQNRQMTSSECMKISKTGLGAVGV